MWYNDLRHQHAKVNVLWKIRLTGCTASLKEKLVCSQCVLRVQGWSEAMVAGQLRMQLFFTESSRRWTISGGPVSFFAVLYILLEHISKLFKLSQSVEISFFCSKIATTRKAWSVSRCFLNHLFEQLTCDHSIPRGNNPEYRSCTHLFSLPILLFIKSYPL